MGRKVNPTAFRLASRFNWSARWYTRGRKYKDYVAEDVRLRTNLSEQLRAAPVSKIEIERSPKSVRLTIHTSKPGLVIGKRGEVVDSLRKKAKTATGSQLEIFVSEVKKPDASAPLIANNLADQIVRRITFKRAIKRLVANAVRAGVLGIKILGSGRLGGAEIARKEWYKEGKVPLHTIDADIDFSTATAKTTFGTIGLKVWVNNGSWKRTKTSN